MPFRIAVRNNIVSDIASFNDFSSERTAMWEARRPAGSPPAPSAITSTAASGPHGMAATASSLGDSLSGAGQENATRAPPPTEMSSLSGASVPSSKIIPPLAEFARSSFTLHRFSAPRTVIPEFPDNSPFASTAFILAAGYFPGAFDFVAAPRAVTHERHKRSVTSAVCTT